MKTIDKMGKQLEKTDIDKVVRKELADMPGLNLKRADGIIEKPSGQVFAAPTEISPALGIEELEKGTMIAAVHVKEAPPGAFLKDGLYSVKVSKDRGGWMAQFIQKGKVVASTRKVKVMETPENIKKPVVTLFSFSPCILCVFLAGVIVGLLLAK